MKYLDYTIALETATTGWQEYYSCDDYGMAERQFNRTAKFPRDDWTRLALFHKAEWHGKRRQPMLERTFGD